MKSENDLALSGFGCIGGLIAAFGAIVAGIILEGFVIMKLWEWFIVPTFGFDTLELPVAIGISTLASVIQNYHDHDKQNKDEGDNNLLKTYGKLFYISIGRPLVFLFIGWIVSMFMN